MPRTMLGAMMAPRAAASELERHSRADRSPFWYKGHRMQVLADVVEGSGSYALVEIDQISGPVATAEAAPDDEVYYILEGSGFFQLGDQLIEAQPGAFVWLPRGVPYAMRVTSGTVRALVFVSSAGFEEYFRAIQASRQSRAGGPRPDRRPAYLRGLNQESRELAV